MCRHAGFCLSCSAGTFCLLSLRLVFFSCFLAFFLCSLILDLRLSLPLVSRSRMTFEISLAISSISGYSLPFAASTNRPSMRHTFCIYHGDPRRFCIHLTVSGVGLRCEIFSSPPPPTLVGVVIVTHESIYHTGARWPPSVRGRPILIAPFLVLLFGRQLPMPHALPILPMAAMLPTSGLGP